MSVGNDGSTGGLDERILGFSLPEGAETGLEAFARERRGEAYSPHTALLAGPDLAAVARGEETLGLGSHGAAVKKLQEALIVVGKLPRGSADGDFGRGTERALLAFQRDGGDEATGKLGARTLRLLDFALLLRGAAIAAPPPAPAPSPAPAASPATRPAPAARPAGSPEPPSSLTDPAEREAFTYVADKLFLGAVPGRVDLAVTDEEAMAALAKLDGLRPKHYKNVILALAATPTRRSHGVGPSLMDDLIVKGTSGMGRMLPPTAPELILRTLHWAFAGDGKGADLSVVFYKQLVAKLARLLETPESTLFPKLERRSVKSLMDDVRKAGIR